jgi:hypothetical protein
LPLLATHLSGKFSNSPAPTAASKSESLLEGSTLLAHLQSKAAWALQKDSQARRMSADNPLWGAPRIHGELLKLGFEIAQSSVAKYMVKRSWPPSQGWRTFLRNHSPESQFYSVRRTG